MNEARVTNTAVSMQSAATYLPEGSPISPLWCGLALQSADALLALIGQYAADDRHCKIDLGVGVFKYEAERTLLYAAVKAAEAELLREQNAKSYVKLEGDIGFFNRLLAFVFALAAMH